MIDHLHDFPIYFRHVHAASNVTPEQLSAICSEVLTLQCFDTWLRRQAHERTVLTRWQWVHAFVLDATGYDLGFLAADEQYTTWRMLHIVSQTPFVQGDTIIDAPSWINHVAHTLHEDTLSSSSVWFITAEHMRRFLKEVHSGVLDDHLPEVRTGSLSPD